MEVFMRLTYGVVVRAREERRRVLLRPQDSLQDARVAFEKASGRDLGQRQICDESAPARGGGRPAGHHLASVLQICRNFGRSICE